MITNKPSAASAVIAAAGNSTRMGSAGNKQFLMLHGKPVLAHTLSTFTSIEEISELIIVTRPQDILLIQDMVQDFGIKKVKAILPGGETRQESVYRGLLEATEERVLIHDGARPFVSANEIKAVLSALATHSAAAPGIPVKDTIKRITPNGLIAETIPREDLVQIQTPQGFIRNSILTAHERASAQGFTATDDCALAEQAGIAVFVTPGSNHNFKITTPEDVALAEAMLAASPGEE